MPIVLIAISLICAAILLAFPGWKIRRAFEDFSALPKIGFVLLLGCFVGEKSEHDLIPEDKSTVGDETLRGELHSNNGSGRVSDVPIVVNSVGGN